LLLAHADRFELRRQAAEFRSTLALHPNPVAFAMYNGHAKAAMLLMHAGANPRLRNWTLPLAPMLFAPAYSLVGCAKGPMTIRVPAIGPDGIPSEEDDMWSDFFESRDEDAVLSPSLGGHSLSQSISIVESAALGYKHLGHLGFQLGIGWSKRNKHIVAIDAG